MSAAQAATGNGARARRRALVSQTRPPEIDRDSGSQQVDLYVRWLQEAGWSVTFVASERDGQLHHAQRMRQLGVPTFIGYEDAEALLQAGEFDLAVLAFWEPASRLLPLIRRVSPETRVIVDSVDLHFLRDARRFLGAGVELDAGYGERVAGELNTYRAADAVLTVSEAEADLLGSFIGQERTHSLPVAKTLSRSSVPFEERSGMFFVGNFRHLPNGEGVEYLCREVLPRLDAELLEAHPLAVCGSRLDDKVRAHARGLEHVRMVGWVPSIRPYLERARVCIVPLLHGAGVKGKIVESLLTGTPVVTTPIGAEGLDLRQGEEAIIGETPETLAEGLRLLLTDADRWRQLADAGYERVAQRHAPSQVGDRFLEIVDEVLALPPREALGSKPTQPTGRREQAYREMSDEVVRTAAAITEAGASVLVVSRGDDDLLDLDGRRAAHFPRTRDGRWAGHHPADGRAAIRLLEEERERGARYLVIPSASFWWLHHYRELAGHLDSRYRRIHSSRHLVVVDLGEDSSLAATRRSQRVALHGAEGARSSLTAELEHSSRFTPADDDPDWTLTVGEGVILPEGFAERFLEVASGLARLGIGRVQPAHEGGPSAGPPATEQVEGIVARELEALTPMPVVAVHRDASGDSPVAIVDAAPIRLAEPLPGYGDPVVYSTVRDVFGEGKGGPRRIVERAGMAPDPSLSVLIATYDRPDLLAGCLEGFCEQSLPMDDFEIVVVDDGSPGPRTEAVLREYAGRLPLSFVRTRHAGRSAAKNVAVMLARGELVLFFDDDDIPAPTLLEEHLAAHGAHADEGTAILGHTEWSPQLAITPLMHYLTDVDKMLFAYGNLEPGKVLNWRCFWEGRISSKRAFHLRHGLHDQRLEYSIDVEMGWRLARHGLKVVYEPAARSFMARAIDFEAFCRRREAKGRAQAAIARIHDDDALREYLGIPGAAERWERAQPELAALRGRIQSLEHEIGSGASDERLRELHRGYRVAFQAYTDKGIAEALDGSIEVDEPEPSSSNGSAPTVPAGEPRPTTVAGAEAPLLTVTMPVWSRTEELVEMATRAIDRVWEVARVPTEVVVVDNGSPEEHPELRARVYRFERNQGVASGWNKGIQLARAPVIAILNSDCWVEPGWDEALYEAASTGRRIAFPYTDHCDGRGFRQPDQAGTAGWCFMLSREVVDEVGIFDERFNPAYVEDTDYWHRAWELGVELTPVPAAHVTHARRTSADQRSDWLLTGHRYLYGWKHGVEPMRPPPYYEREIVEYHGGSGASTSR